MSSQALVNWEVSVKNEGGYPIHRTPPPRRFSPAAGPNGLVQSVSLTASASTTIPVPTGARFMALILGQATGLTIKGVAGDVGIPIAPTANPLALDALIPLAGATSFVITSTNTSAQVVEVIFL